MEQGVSDAEGDGGGTADAPVLADVLVFLEASVEALCAVDWTAYDADALADAVVVGGRGAQDSTAAARSRSRQRGSPPTVILSITSSSNLQAERCLSR